MVSATDSPLNFFEYEINLQRLSLITVAWQIIGFYESNMVGNLNLRFSLKVDACIFSVNSKRATSAAMVSWIHKRKFKREIRFLFHVMERRPYWLSHMDMYIFIRRDHWVRSPRIIVTEWITARYPLCVHDVVYAGKASHACLAGVATKKSRGTITLLHTWP